MSKITPKGDLAARGRSCSYPGLSLSESISLAQKIADGLGLGPHDRLTLSKGLGYSSFSGAASIKIGAMVQFGLFERSKGFYSLTALAREIFTYPAETSFSAIATAAAAPALYRKLIDKFAPGALPQNLAAVLSAGYGITDKAAAAAAANFNATMEFAGILKDNVLGTPATNSQSDCGSNMGLQSITPRAGAAPLANDKRIKIELPSGAAVLLPESAAYRLSMGEFAQEIRDLDRKAGS